MNTKIAKRTLVVAMGLVGSGLVLFGAAGSAKADPPRRVPAHGYRDKWTNDHNRRDRRHDDRRSNGKWDRDRDGIPNYRDRRPFTYDRYGRNRWSNNTPSWRRIDSDRDGVPNYRDRHPNDRRRR